MSGKASDSVIDATHGRGTDTYDLPAACLNCGWRGTVIRAKGYSVIGMKFRCPNCGCNEVTASGRKVWP